MATKDDLIQLICWLASVATKQADCRHEAIALPSEECKEYLIMQSPIIQTSMLQQKIRDLGTAPTDQDALRRALYLAVSKVEGDRNERQ